MQDLPDLVSDANRESLKDLHHHKDARPLPKALLTPGDLDEVEKERPDFEAGPAPAYLWKVIEDVRAAHMPQGEEDPAIQKIGPPKVRPLGYESKRRSRRARVRASRKANRR